MSTTSADIQALIDAKVALISSLTTQLASVIANPKPSYNIDGQQVDWNTYQKYLGDLQMNEIDALKKLYELQNIIAPYQYQSGTNSWGLNGWGY